MKKFLWIIAFCLIFLMSCEWGAMDASPDSSPAAELSATPAAESLSSGSSRSYGVHSNGASLSEWINMSRWMSYLDNSLRITQITIPGSHDSGSLHDPILFPDAAKTQDAGIARQLEMGVRFLDIRNRHIENVFAIHHGPVFQEMFFGDVLRDVYAFLDDNPTETIIMRIKEEHSPSGNTRTFDETLVSQYINSRRDKWFIQEYIPYLYQVRGKIILLRNFEQKNPHLSPLGIDLYPGWNKNDNYDEVRTEGNDKVVVQDRYDTTINRKKSDVALLFTKTRRQSYANEINRLYLNFISGYKTVSFFPKISVISDALNPWLRDYLKARDTRLADMEGNHPYQVPRWRYLRLGIVIMDFVGPGRVEALVKTNFRHFVQAFDSYYNHDFIPGSYAVRSMENNEILTGQTTESGGFDGPLVVLEDGHTFEDNQRWQILPLGSRNHYRIVNLATGYSLGMDTSSRPKRLVQKPWVEGDRMMMWDVRSRIDSQGRKEFHIYNAARYYYSLDGSTYSNTSWRFLYYAPDF